MAFARMVAALAASQPFELLGDGTQSRSFTYVKDAVDATIGAMERANSGSTLNVGGGEEVSMLEAIDALERIAGRRLEIVRSPRREGDATRTAADTARIRAEIGWESTTSFEEGLAAQWRWAADRVAAA
jgi:nucleoside-diphosphate-sugar epimerase